MLAALGSRNSPIRRRLQPTLRALQSALPADAQRHWAESREFLGGEFEWAYVVPEYETPDGFTPCPLISEHVDGELAVLAYGDMHDGRAHGTCASRVAEAYAKSGAASVTELNGNFGALVLDLRTRVLHLACDLVGRRRLRYVRTSDGVIVASHDAAALVAAGEAPEWDFTSAASVVGFGFSLDGKSLLRNVHVNASSSVDRFVRSSGGTRHTTEQSRSPLQPRRLDAGDTHGLLDLRRRCVDAMDDYFLSRWDGESTVRASMTAGLDSRSALALIRPHVPSDRLTTQTAGAACDLEVETARQVSELYGYPHQVVSPAPTTEHFEANLRYRAFHFNGMTNAKRCFVQHPGYRKGPLRAGGEFGETLRGFYYAKLEGDVFASPTALRERGVEVPHRAWARAALLDGHLDFGDRYPERADLRERVVDRLDAVLGRYEASSSDGRDILDSFYIHQRLAEWALASQLPEDQWRCAVFGSTELARLSFQFPCPMGASALHEHLIRERLPESLPVPINGTHVFGPVVSSGAGSSAADTERATPRVDASAVRPHRAVHSTQSTMMSQLISVGRHPFPRGASFADELVGGRALRELLEPRQLSERETQALGFLWMMTEFSSLIHACDVEVGGSLSRGSAVPASPA